MLTPEEIAKVRTAAGAPPLAENGKPQTSLITKLGLDKPPEPAPVDTSYTGRLKTDFSNRQNEMVDVTARSGLAGEKKQTTAESVLQTLGVGAGVAQDFLTESGKSIFNTAMSEMNHIPGFKSVKDSAHSALTTILNTPLNKAGIEVAKQGAEKYDVWKKTNPRAAADIESVVNIAALFPVVEGAGKLATAAPDILAGAKGAAKDIASVAKVAGDVPVPVDEAFVKELVTPQLNVKGDVSAIKSGKVVEGKGVFGERDFTGALPNFEKAQQAVSEVPGISPKKTLLENANAIHDHIGAVARDLRGQIVEAQTQIGKDRGFFTPNELKGYMNGVKSSIAENPTMVGNAEQTAMKILNKFNSLVKEKGYTPEGLLDARQALDVWMQAQKGANVFDPATDNAVSAALRGIRQGANGFLASKVPSVPVQELFAKQTALYDAIENIAPKAAKEGASGFKRFVKAHPRLVKAAQYGATAVVGGGVLKHLSP